MRYWPNEGQVSFYGHVNAGGTFNKDVSTPKFENFTVNPTVSNQVDLLYAVKKQTKSEGTQVNLNFRHALSQIVFQAKNTYPSLYVEIEGVTVKNVCGKGSYTLPSGNTDANLSHPGGTGTEEENSRGQWTLSDDDKTAEYSVTFTAVALNGAENAAPSPLTTYTEPAAKNNNAMLLIPSTTTAYNPNTNLKTTTDSYFLVKCKIWNVAGSSVDKDNDVVLWAGKDGGAANVLLPVGFQWEEGKKYTYTFVFGKGHGGYDPDPEDPDPNPDDPYVPDPVLVPITFEVSVDEFIPVVGEEITGEVPTPEETPETGN